MPNYKHKRTYILFVAASFLLTLTATAQTDNKAWVTKSNSYTKMLIDIDEKYSPESGSGQGLAFFDTLIVVPTLANDAAQRNEKTEALAKIKSARQTETNASLKQDLDILVRATELSFRQEDFEHAKKAPYINATEIVFGGIQILLDDQTPAARRAAALSRLRKYAGLEKGYRPLTDILKERTLKQMRIPGVIYSSKQQMEVTLSRNPSEVTGIEELFKKYQLTGWEQPYTTIKKQLADYDAWVKAKLVPKGAKQLSQEEYQMGLEGYGIDIPPAQLAKIAHTAFIDIQNQMKPLAEQIAKKYSLPSNDYRDVIKYLKKDQIIGDSIMPLYRRHLADIEEIIRRQHLVTLPSRPAIIRLASEAETAQSPAPHMVPPPFLNNTGQRGVFVLPLNMPPAKGEKVDKYDDFTFDAASWTIIAHEARPGHELQFDKMVEEGVSQARALYAFNSVNVEGWGLYSEYITRPYMPLEGQLISLDYRLLRAARAFLDPELQAGTTSPEQAMQILMNDVVASHAFAKQEVERYTINSPGQANSYFYGFTKMIALRKDAEQALGSKFNQQHFHDFILSQGILPPALIREAVMGDFVLGEK